MGKKEELKSTHNLVKTILIKDKKARNSDAYLYIKVIEKLNKGVSKMPFTEVMINRKEYGIPCYDTVTRTRRKLQELNPDLQGDDRVTDMRTKNQMTFEEYAKNTR